MKKETVAAELLGRWRRRGSAHLDNQLCAGNRSRLWESKLGSTSHPSPADPGSGTRGSGDGPPPPQRPLISSPTPHAPAAFLGAPSRPFPSARAASLGRLTVTRRFEPLISIAIWAPPELGPAPPPPPARGAALAPRGFALAVPALCSRPCRLAPAAGLATRFRRLEFRKVARPHVQRLRAEVRGRQGAARGAVLAGRAGGREPGPRLATAATSQCPALPKAVRLCRVWARKQQPEGEAGGPPRRRRGPPHGSCRRTRTRQDGHGRPGAQTQTPALLGSVH